MSLEAVWGESVPKPKMAYSPAIRAGEWLFAAGQLASDFATGLASAAAVNNAYIDSPLHSQGSFVMDNIASTLAPTGAQLSKDAVRVSRWFTSASQAATGGASWAGCGVEDYLTAEARWLDPDCVAASTLGIGALMVCGTEVEIDVISRLDGAPTEVIRDSTGRAVGIRRGQWVFLSAHAVPERGDSTLLMGVAAQTERVLEDLGARAGLAGSSLARAVKAEVFLRDPRDQPAFERVWFEQFSGGGPAKVVVTSVAPRHPFALVEVALTLLTDSGDLTIRQIVSGEAPDPLGSGPQAVRAGDLLFFSTQMAFDSSGGLAPTMTRSENFPWYGSPGRAQMRYVLDNVEALCAAGGTSIANVVRRVCYHDDLQWFGESIDEWAARLPGLKPASTTMEVAGPLGVPGANTLLDLIAYVPSGSA